jgi:hypothetical protein
LDLVDHHELLEWPQGRLRFGKASQAVWVFKIEIVEGVRGYKLAGEGRFATLPGTKQGYDAAPPQGGTDQRRVSFAVDHVSIIYHENSEVIAEFSISTETLDLRPAACQNRPDAIAVGDSLFQHAPELGYFNVALAAGHHKRAIIFEIPAPLHHLFVVPGRRILAELLVRYAIHVGAQVIACLVGRFVYEGLLFEIPDWFFGCTENWLLHGGSYRTKTLASMLGRGAQRAASQF